MKRLWFLFFIITMTLGAYVNFGVAATKKGEKSGSKTNDSSAQTNTQPQYDKNPFDLSLEQLPPNYIGQDIEQITGKLQKAEYAKKDEFETTEEYNKKVQATVSAITDSTYYAFREESPNISYNADTQELKIKLYFPLIEEILSKDKKKRFWTGKMELEKQREYLATNAFGATTTVSDWHVTHWFISMISGTDFGIDLKEFLFKMSPEEAKVAKTTIGVLLICNPKKIDGNFTWGDTDYTRPTFDDPERTIRNKNYLNVELAEIWFYNLHSGKIIWKVKIKKPQTENAEENVFRFRPIEKWIGEKFIFLKQKKSLQHYGYVLWKKDKEKYDCPTYEECVGRIGTVIKVIKDYVVWKVTLQMDDNGQVYTADAYNESINDVAPFFDIENAREKWLGKTLWYPKSVNTRTGEDDLGIWIYDESKDKDTYFKVGNNGPLKVIEITPSFDEHCPVRFFLQTINGVTGFVDVNLSGTNISEKLREFNRFEKYFVTEDPVYIYPKKWTN